MASRWAMPGASVLLQQTSPRMGWGVLHIGGREQIWACSGSWGWGGQGPDWQKHLTLFCSRSWPPEAELVREWAPEASAQHDWLSSGRGVEVRDRPPPKTTFVKGDTSQWRRVCIQRRQRLLPPGDRCACVPVWDSGSETRCAHTLTGAEARTVLPKKEKLKLRRERWLQKIEAIKLAEQKRKAERRRRATVVVGDLQPLRDALPELLELEAAGRQPRTRGVSSRPRPAEFSRMSAAQRLQLLEEESARFRELLANPTYRASPLLAIGQRLAQQIQLDSGSQL
ncbi:Ribosome biogenesis protein SLX9 homolog [Vulpes lagopus]|uniref:protein FAM207A isoform X2 n=1 Tax=Vulpes lagopus TaxID=494514 RepID=UPI001BC9C898|nr:protein FAM207A isoform X2 [Vulpes lagopus]